MKKFGLLAGMLSALMLGGCIMLPPSENTPEKENIPDDVAAEVLNAAKDQTLAFVSRSESLLPDIASDIGWSASNYYNNDYLYLVTKQTVRSRIAEGKTYTAAIEWVYDKNDTFVREEVEVDDTHHALYFNYSKTEEHDFSFTAKLTCGNVDPIELNYSVHLKLKNVEFLELSIADIYAVNDSNTGFKLVDPETGYYAKNNENFDYACVETQGEVVYLSPDGNWGLVADGDRVLELYSGSANNLSSAYYPALTVGNVVKVQAELGSYFGNCQISFIFDIVQGDPSKITPFTGYKNLAEADFAGKKYWEGNLMNGLRTVTATYQGNLKDRNDAAVNDPKDLANNRFTFEVKVGNTTLKVAYDYHVDRDGAQGVFDAYKNKLKSLSVGATITLKGTVRYAGDVQKTYLNQKGTWSIVPFLVDHFA